jgi:hypothetical protein
MLKKQQSNTITKRIVPAAIKAGGVTESSKSKDTIALAAAVSHVR